jgi:hypothetical protein
MAKKPKDNVPGGDLGGKVAQSSATLAALAMRGGDTWQKLVVYCCYLISAVAILVISLPPYETLKQLASLFGIVVPLFCASIFVMARYRRLTGEEVAPQPAPLLPPAPPPAAPTSVKLSSATRDRMFSVLEEARVLVRDRLQQKKATLEDKQVRANIFFPDYDGSGNCSLKIRPGLHVHMTEPELGIALGPGQGVTSHVLAYGEPRVAQRLPEAESGWDTTYQITPKLAAIINPQLRWIISMPLKMGESKPVGVMNIDGLVHQFSVDDLYECARNLTQLAMVLAGLAMGT